VRRLRVVFDTNVYISALIFSGSKGEEVYLFAVRGKIKLYTSVAILAELAKKLREKFHWEDRKITAVLKHISKVATVIKPDVKIELLTDKPDNRVLECAMSADANLIVTGDRHLLVLKEYKGTGITTVAGFLYSFNTKNKTSH